MLIFGVDPGIEKFGWAGIKIEEDKVVNVYSGMIKTSQFLLQQERIENIYQKLKNLLEKYQPDLVVLEDLFYFKNKKTVIKVAQAQGIVLLLASQLKVPVKVLSPLQIKKAITGYGKADKKAIEKMVYLSLPIEKIKREDDEMDAIACAYAGSLIFKNDGVIRK